jgi:hypothetical protein
MFDWLIHSLGAWAPWALPVVVWWLSRRMRSRRQAFWVWLTDEHFYKGFGFLGLLWPLRERKRVWPKVMEEEKLVYLERLEKARLYRGGQLPKWWVALANIRLLGRMASHAVEMFRTTVVANVTAIAFRTRRPSSETAKERPQIVNAVCHIEAARVVEFGGTAKLRMKNSGDLTVGDSK